MLALRQISCHKGDKTLFEQLQLSLSAGQLLFVRGENGVGKTTLLRIMAGLARPDDGQVIWCDNDIADTPESFNQALLYLGHKTGICGAMSARENLLFWQELQGLPELSDPYAILATLGLVGVEDIPATLLSAGQQRRAALARLWLKIGGIWILDEPYTALDSKGIALVDAQIQRHREKGGIVVMTSHQLPSFSDAISLDIVPRL